MPYTKEQSSHLIEEQEVIAEEMRHLMLQTVVQGQESSHKGIREHLLHGVARRIGVLGRAIENIYRIFPPSARRPLERDSLSDVQINLHAFVINLYGIFDNWAWAFVFRHELEIEVGGKRGVGLFYERTAKYLPSRLRDYLSSPTTKNWYEEYLKSFRDSLAHRIPLYIPPAELTREESERYEELENRKAELIKKRQWEHLDEAWAEQAEIGRPSFVFLHAFSEDEPPKPVLFHPQVLSDARSVIEFGKLFLECWNERS